MTDYSGSDESNKEFTYTKNANLFGVEDDEIDFYIYTNPECVKVAATFWGYRYAHSWRQIAVTSFLPSLPIESYDWIIFSNSNGFGAFIDHLRSGRRLGFGSEICLYMCVRAYNLQA